VDDPNYWRRRLAEAEKKERSGDFFEALSLRTSLVEDWTEHQNTRGLTGFAEFDFLILDRLAGMLHEIDQNKEALKLLTICLEKAIENHDSNAEIYFSCRGIHCCVALLDFASASHRMNAILPSHGDFDGRFPESLVSDVLIMISDQDNREYMGNLRVSVLTVLARLWAARGRLKAADCFLTKAREISAPLPKQILDPWELRLFQAEVRLDAGDFEGAIELTGSPDDQECPDRICRCATLLGGALKLEGKYTEAVGMLRDAVARLKGHRSAARINDIASLNRQLFHALVLLNRLNEAEKVLMRLKESGVLENRDFLHLQEVLEGRRGVIFHGTRGEATAKDILDNESRQFEAESIEFPRLLAAESLDSPQRTVERVRTEWARLANAIMSSLRGYELRLLYFDQEPSLPTSGGSLVQVSYSASLNLIHICVFDAEGQAVVNTSELEISHCKENDLKELKTLVIEHVANPKQMPPKVEQVIAEKACLVTGHLYGPRNALVWLVFLKQLLKEIDSTYLQAKFYYLLGLTAFHLNRASEAITYARKAGETFNQLNLLPDFWASNRLETWTLLQFSPRETQRINETQARAEAASSRMESMMSFEDRDYYRLNKWNLSDELVLSLLSRHPSPPSGRKAVKLAEEALQIRLNARLKGYAASPTSDSAPDNEQLEAARQFSLDYNPLLRGKIRRIWIPQNTAIIIFFLLPDKLETAVIHLGGANFLPPRSINRQQLWQLTGDALADFQSSTESWRELDDSEKPLELADALGIPQIVESLPKRVDRLYILPEGFLFQVPFAGLPLDSGQPLVQRFRLTIVTELNWLIRNCGRFEPQLQALGVHVGSTQVKAPDGSDYKELSNAMAETGTMANAFHHVKQSTGAKLEVTSALSNSAVVHFACHGEFYPENPLSSALILEDDLLTAAEISSMNLEATATVILASCWGGNLAVNSASVLGLPTAFLAAGCDTVSASLWRVPDREIAELFGTFYCHELRKRPFDIGFSENLGDQEVLDHIAPRAWAGYVTYAKGLPTNPWGKVSHWVRRTLARPRNPLVADSLH